MITYNKTACGLHLLLRLYGSAIPRTLIFSAVSTGIAAILYATKQIDIYDDWRHPYPFQGFAGIVGFIIVFRSNLSYGRYWDGRQQLQKMTASWADFCMEALAMDGGLLHVNAAQDPKAWAKAQTFAQSLVHLTSLMHAVALQHLRSDWELANLTPYRAESPPPPLDAAALFNSKQGTKVHWMWIRSLFKGAFEQKGEYNRAMSFPVVSSLSAEELVELGQMHEKHSTHQTGTLITGNDVVSNDGIFSSWIETLLVRRRGRHVPEASERINIVFTWIQQLLQDRKRAGGMAEATSTVWSLLSNGYSQFEQCRVLADTPFPFPWAQMVLILLILYALLVPLLVVAFVNRTWVGLVINFISVQSYWTLNEVARDLEDPFVYDPNDLPLARYQYQFNKRILASAKTRRPISNCEKAACMPSAHVDTPASVFQQQLHDTSTSVMQLLRSDGRQELEQDGLEQDGSV